MLSFLDFDLLNKNNYDVTLDADEVRSRMEGLSSSEYGKKREILRQLLGMDENYDTPVRVLIRSTVRGRECSGVWTLKHHRILELIKALNVLEGHYEELRAGVAANSGEKDWFGG